MTPRTVLSPRLVEDALARCTVPGVAVAVVAGGRTVLTAGFGRQDQHAPVTSLTRFMLASDTKCFAAAALCLLVEDGLLDLDQPVREVLPWFAMHDDSRSALVTTRDLLAHRTGLPRHDLLTVGDGPFRVTTESVARSMRHLEAHQPFRAGFGYNNAHYATAGHVAEVLSGRPWAQLLDERVLRPLGAVGTTTYAPELTATGFARPHVAGRPVPFQSRRYDLPGGGLVTHAEDLARWLHARLGRGPLSPAVLALLHTPVLHSGSVPPLPELVEVGYALGNLACTYRGHALQLHGGSQIGYSSQVLVLPEAQVGVAVLANAHATQLPLALGLTVVDELLGLGPADWCERLAPPSHAPAGVPPTATPPLPARPAEECTGTYHHPAYGDLTVTPHADGLAASFHGLDRDLALTHRGDDAWQLAYRVLPGATFALTFGAGRPAQELHLAAEPALAPLVFRRR